MEIITNALNLIPKERLEKIRIVARLEGKSEARIIHDTTVTSLTLKSSLRLKDIYNTWMQNGEKISAYAGKLKIKGRNPWADGTHGMPDHVKYLYEYFSEEEVNKDILESACRLIQITLDDVFENATAKTSDKYKQALSNDSFVYMMLRVSLRILAEDLRREKIELQNRTLQHMTDMIKKDNIKIRKVYQRAMVEGDINGANQLYYETLDNYFKEYMNKNFNVTGEEIQMLGKEKMLLDYVGEETVYTFLGYLCGEIKKKYPHQLALQGFYQIDF